MMGKKGGLVDLEKHFAFYGAYHSDPANILIHILFVWPIFFTALLLFYFTPPLFHLPPLPLLPFDRLPLLLVGGGGTGGGDGGGLLVFNLGFVFAVVYALCYVSLDRKAGSLAALLCALCWVGSSCLGSHLGFSLAWKVVLAVQLLCWTAQFIGHGVFEKRAPALLDNLSQALLMAPFFVLLEVLQKLFDYEPYPGFRASVHAKIEADRKELQSNKQKKSS